MTVLGIETSTAVCSVGLADDRGTRIHMSIIEAHIHSEKLLTLVEKIMSEAGSARSSLDGVAVSIGPGSFTGLRIGLSSAKGLCYAFAKPLITVPTLLAIAAATFRSSPSARKILVALDAKKGDFYVGLYANGLQISEIEGAGLAGIEEIVLKDRSETPDLIITDQPDTFRTIMGKSTCLDVHEFCRGDAVAELGLSRLASGETADLASTEPLYLKDFVVHGGRQVSLKTRR